ncbi:hypothetical protein JB92DRAFT_2985005 [Gautieria morchelliformis]|nr:hypothetical protein JB92DRAFT_2985005 [Gautieria morchelliformis]
MSSDPRDYHRSSRNELPPIREVVGDALDSHGPRPPAGPSKHDRFQRPGHVSLSACAWAHSAPLRLFSPGPPRSHRERSPVSPPERTPRRTPPRDPSYEEPETSRPEVFVPPTTTNPQPATGPATYSYNVLRTQQGDLVDVRTPSSRAQGILRPTAIIEDEDDSHKRYRCDWPDCDKKYDRPSSLEVHRHTHTGSQPYPCQYPGCDRAFNVKSNMLRHFRSHPQPKSRKSGKQRADENQTDDEDDDEKWPEKSSSSRYFHQTSSAPFRLRPPSPKPILSLSPAATSASSKQQHSSSKRR